MSGEFDRDFARLEAGEAPEQAPQVHIVQVARSPKETPILTMSTLLPERDWLTIDGRRYDLARYHDLTLYQHAKFGRTYSRALDLFDQVLGQEADALAEAALADLEAELGTVSRDATAMILRKCPRTTVGRLGVEDRMRACGAFQQAVTRWRLGLVSPPVGDQPTGAASSTPSPPDSAKDPAGGSDEPASGNSFAPTGD